MWLHCLKAALPDCNEILEAAMLMVQSLIEQKIGLDIVKAKKSYE